MSNRRQKQFTPVTLQRARFDLGICRQTCDLHSCQQTSRWKVMVKYTFGWFALTIAQIYVQSKRELCANDKQSASCEQRVQEGKLFDCPIVSASNKFMLRVAKCCNRKVLGANIYLRGGSSHYR